MRTQPKNRFLRLLRKTAATAQKKAGARIAADENALWLAHERAAAAVRVAQDALSRVVATSTKQRGSIDGVADAGRGLGTRAAELERQAARVVEAFERLSIIALNASLEAARLGEAQGRALALVSDEVRVHATRGTEAARGLAGFANEVGLEAGSLAARLDEARAPLGEVSAEALRAQGAANDADAALVAMHERLRRATGHDPETMRALSEAAEHARALVSSFGSLSGKVPRALLIGVLSPVLEPLLRILADDEPAEEGT